MSGIDLDEMRSWSTEAGILARQYFNQARSWRKADNTWVTEADEAVERMLVERIATRYPDHGIIGEEQTRSGIDREFLWAIDPIDGTASFVNGLASWGISIGLLRDGIPYLGVIYLPILDDIYWCDSEGNAFWNEQRIHVAPYQTAWNNEDWLSIPSDAHRHFQIDFPGKTRSLGCSIASLAYVARGSAIGALLTRAAIWDIAAGLAILHAAGGRAIDLTGQPLHVGAMIDGSKMPVTCVFAEPAQAEALRSVITELAVDGVKD